MWGAPKVFHISTSWYAYAATFSTFVFFATVPCVHLIDRLCVLVAAVFFQCSEGQGVMSIYSSPRQKAARLLPSTAYGHITGHRTSHRSIMLSEKEVDNLMRAKGWGRARN